jgi:hypothetical protein
MLLLAALQVAACGQAVTPQEPVSEDVVLMPSEAAATEELPDYKWNQLLSRDSILPIYDPEFVPAEKSGYDDQELVMGVEIGGEAKAYPVGPLNSREMVNDEVGGTPILVTW